MTQAITSAPLIKEMTKTWGNRFENMTTNDTLWLISRVGHQAWLDDPEGKAPGTEADEIAFNLHEINFNQKLAFLRELPTSDFNQSDTLWLIHKVAHETWQETEEDEPPTAAAESVRDRLHELSLNQKISLLQTLINS